jgi:hypothetical protein
MKGRLFRLGLDIALALCNHSLTLIYVEVSMRKHRVKMKEVSYSLTNNCYRRHDNYD